MQKSSIKYEQTKFNNTQKGSNTTLKLDSFQGCREGSTYVKWKQKVITTLKKGRLKHNLHFNRCKIAFDKMHHPSRLKLLDKVGIEGTCLNIKKVTKANPQPIYNTQQWKAESLSAKFRNKTRMPTLTTFIQNSIGSPRQSKSDTARNKWYPAGSKEVQMSRWHYQEP